MSLEYNQSHLRRAREILFGDSGADDTDEDSGPWLVRPVDLAKHIAAGETAWRIMYQHESRWANLPTSEREAALQKALESTTADQIKAEDEVERLRAALTEISELGDVRADEACLIARRALNDGPTTER